MICCCLLKKIFYFLIVDIKNYLCVPKNRSAYWTGNIYWPVRLGVRTPDFHSGNRGSIPLRATHLEVKTYKSLQIKRLRAFCFLQHPDSFNYSHKSSE